LCRNFFLKHFIEGQTQGTGRRGRGIKTLLDDHQETRKYWKLKEETLHLGKRFLKEATDLLQGRQNVMMMMMMMMMMMVMMTFKNILYCFRTCLTLTALFSSHVAPHYRITQRTLYCDDTCVGEVNIASPNCICLSLIQFIKLLSHPLISSAHRLLLCDKPIHHCVQRAE
jgi:hypothetical protein